MRNIRTKIFLCGYLNYINAQNLNCLALAQHLDKDRFEVFSLSCHFGHKVETNENIYYCFKPFRLSRILGLIWGIWKCDVAYFPKHLETPKWALKLATLIGRKIFTTIEINMNDNTNENMVHYFGGEQKLLNHFKHIPNIFGITKYIIDNALKNINIQSDVLYLGVDTTRYTPMVKSKPNNFVFVGSLVIRKRVKEILQLTWVFPNNHFHIIGDGIQREELEKQASDNVTFYGKLNHEEIALMFQNIDVLFLPSKSEGFPKVILEAAASGIPSIVYDSYGANQWIENGKNGFIVSEFDQVKKIIIDLQEQPNLLAENSKAAIELSKLFDWNIVIKKWEEVIINLHKDEG